MRHSRLNNFRKNILITRINYNEKPFDFFIASYVRDKLLTKPEGCIWHYRCQCGKIKREIGNFSVSVGIVKDSKIYTRHFGEIDKGKGNKADDNTYFEIASVTKLFNNSGWLATPKNASNTDGSKYNNLLLKL